MHKEVVEGAQGQAGSPIKGDPQGGEDGGEGSDVGVVGGCTAVADVGILQAGGEGECRLWVC